MPLPTDLFYLGVAKESSKGVGVSPTNFIPVLKSRTWQDVIMPLDDTASRGAAIDGPWDQIAGPLYGTYAIPDGPVFADALPWLTMGIMGDYTSLASRSVADGVTNSTTTLTSATAVFTSNDVGRPIGTSADFAAGTYIVSVTNATTVILNQAALTSGASKTILIGGNAAVVSHWGSVKNSGDAQAGSLTLSDFYGLTGTHTRQFAGMQVAKVTLKFNGDGLFTAGGNLTGFASALVAKPSPSFTAIPATPGWENIVSIAGSGFLQLVSGELTLERNVNVVNTSDGTQAPRNIFLGGLKVTGKITVIAEDDSDYQHYLSYDKPALTYNFRHGTGASFIGTLIQMSKVNYALATPNHGGDYMSVDATINALPNATDVGATGGAGGQIRIHHQNSIAAATYQ